MNYQKSTLGSLIALSVFFCALATVFAETYYVSTNGSVTNSGLSTNAPWSLGKISYKADIPSNSTIIVLPGIYEETNTQNTVAGPVLWSPYITMKSQVKWGAVLRDSSDDGISALTNYITIDGFRIIGAFKNGIVGSESAGGATNLIVRNCWISFCGTNPASGMGPSGIADGPNDNTLIENNLIEHIGNIQYSIYDHGVYLAGANLTIRNNVIRYCVGAGIQLNDHTAGCKGSTNVMIYNNLIYNNGQWGMYLSSDWSNSVSTTLFNNTVIGNRIALAAETIVPGITYMNCSNNIIIANGQTLKKGSRLATNSVINADYNIMAIVDNMPLGAHGILTNNAWLVNTNNGLFWLMANSPACGAAYSGLYPSNDFFGNKQTSSVDIGAFQYNVLYGLDTRVLDPSPEPPSYWVVLTKPPTPSNFHLVPGSGK